MAISHVKSVTIADFTGTVTVFNSAGATTTANATDIVRPTDWNSVHNQYFTLTGNTNNASTASGSNVVLSGGNGVTLIGSNSRIGFSVADQSVQTQNMVSVQGSTGAVVFSNSNGITFGGNASTITASHNGLTTARASNDAIGLNTAQTNVTWTVNSSGLSFNAAGYAGTGTSATNASITLNSNGLAVSVAAPGAGGGIAAAAGTQTATSGTVVFANSNGLTFGMSGSSQITASHNGLTTARASNDAIGLNTAITQNGVSMTANSSGLSLNFPAFLTTAALSNHSHGNPTLNLTNLSGTTASNSAGLTLSLSAAAPGAATLTLSATGNTTQSSTGTIAGSSVLVRGSGGVSAGISNGSILIEGPALTSLSVTGALSASSNGSTISLGVGTVTVSATSNTTNGSSGTVNLNGLIFKGQGAASVGVSNGSIVFDAPSAAAGNITISAGANSAGLASLVFSNSNGVSFGLNGSTITATATFAQSVQTQSNVQGIIVSNTTYRTGDVSFSNANGISFGSSAGQAITASYTVPTQSAQTIGLYASSQTTGQSSSSTVDARSITLVGQGNISVGLSGGSFLISQTGGGGGIAASLSGNSTSGGAGYSNITSGTMILAGGNNITLSQDGSRITISGPNVGGAQTGISSVALSDTTYTSGQISFRDLNGITWQSTTGQAIQITHGLQYTSNTSAITSNAMHSTSRPAFSADASSTFQTLTLQNSNGISFSNNAGAIRITHDLQYTSATSAITSAALHTSASRVINIVAATNNTGGGTASLSSNVSFSAANGLTFYTSAGGAIVGSHNALTSQSNQAFSAGAAASTFQTLSFQDSNGVSFSNNAGAIRVTHALAGTGTTVATSNHGLSMTLNSAGLNISATGLNQAVSNSAGSFTFQTLNFSNANNVTWGTSAGNIITASVAAPGAAAENNWMNLLGANTSGDTTASGSTIGLSGINMTLSGTNGSVVNFSVPATSSLSAEANITIGTTGSTIGFSVGAPGGGVTYSYFNPQDAYLQVTGQQGQSTLHMQPAKFPNVQFDRWVIPIHNTNSSNSSGSHTVSFNVGIYSNNAGTLSLMMSTSSSTAVTHSGTAGSYSLYSGIRLFTIPHTTTVTEGQYWIGILSRTTSGGANGTYNQILASQQNSSFFGHFGSAVNKSIQYTRGLGILSVQTAALPSAVNFTDISGASNSLVLRQPILYMVSGTF